MTVKLLEKVERAIELANRLEYLNIFITKCFDSSLKQAQAIQSCTASTLSLPLAGNLLAVKDCYSTKDILTTCGSKMLSNYAPPYTATVVERLVNRGCVMLGKTNLDEFCMGASSTESFYGPVKNPWTLKMWQNEQDIAEKVCQDWFLAGGSSGGSAAAVAVGLVDIALGSDTGGSTRNPASFCGVVGYKPSYGLLSRHGLIPLTNSLDVPGLLAKTVDKIALALDSASGIDTKDPTSIEKTDNSYQPVEPNLRNFVVGLPEEYLTENLSPCVVRWWKTIAGLLEQNGCRLKVVSLPHTRYSIVCYHVLGECEVASNMARYDGVEYGYRADQESSQNQMYAESRHQSFNEVVRRRILTGNYFLLKKNYQKYYLKSLKVRRKIADDFYRLFRHGDDSGEKVDVLLAPVTSSEAPLYSQWKSDDEGYSRERSDDYFTQPVNMAGLPAISLPVGLSENGLPIGLQFIADVNQDKRLLSIAKFVENIVEFPHLKSDDIKFC